MGREVRRQDEGRIERLKEPADRMTAERRRREAEARRLAREPSRTVNGVLVRGAPCRIEWVHDSLTRCSGTRPRR